MTPSTRIIFGRSVCRLRTRRGLTQEKLAELSEIDPRHLQRIEHGEANPSLEVVVALQRVLAVPWDDLMRGLGWPCEALARVGHSAALAGVPEGVA